ncbi:MAG: hypothetical protein KA198_07410, partial [Chitinophagaceae bacterium]|nr:hypothetical protein [Chitinophagaceae bacterium]
LDTQEILIPTMILQPFIENSIEHGLKENLHHGKIEVSFKLFNQELHIEIIDNGIGIQTIHKHQHHISRATQIISDRFYLLNLKHHQPYKYTIKPAANNRGTCVEIILPLIYSDETTYN